MAVGNDTSGTKSFSMDIDVFFQFHVFLVIK